MEGQGVDTYKEVKGFYGTERFKEGAEDNATCSAGGKPLYKSAKAALSEVHDQVISKYYGCGNPIPECLEGTTILDLGCGTGRDVYICSKLAGENGKVIGLDMTDEPLELAREYISYHQDKFGYKNVEFHQGYIEDFVDKGVVAPNSVDVVISNCVICLSPDKKKVFEQVWKCLKEGGELYFSDMYCDRRVPESLKADSKLWNEGIGGSLYVEDFRRIMADIGFKDIRVAHHRKTRTDLATQLPQRYFSTTVRAFKVDNLEDKAEDYGIKATYKGGIPDFEETFEFDKNYMFKVGEETDIDRNTAETLKTSRFKAYFEVTDEKEHLGLFSKQSLWGCTKSNQCS